MSDVGTGASEGALGEYDSRPDTYAHIAQVRGLLLGAVQDLIARAHRHDSTKLEPPELEAFDVASPRLRELTYGTPEYHRELAHMQGALRHHYAAWDHHPEHFAPTGGIEQMGLLEMLEMLCDWIAAGRRHRDGDIRASIEKNRERFGYGDEVARLLHNTVDDLERLELSTDPPRSLVGPGT